MKLRALSKVLGSATLLALTAFASGALAEDAPPAPSASSSAATTPAPGAASTATDATDADKKDEAKDDQAAPPPDAKPSLFTATLPNEPPKATGAPGPGDKDKVEPKKEKEKLRWADTQFFQQLGVTPNVFSPGSVQSPDPVVDTFLLFQPRFALNKDWQLRARLTANYEFTDNVNSGTTRKREFRFGDISTSIFYRGIPTVAGIKPLLGLNLGLPVSVESQARTMIVSPSLTLSLVKPIEHVLGGDLTLILTTSFAHPFYKYTTAGLENPAPYERQCASPGDSSCGLQSSGASNPANILSFIAVVSQEWGKLNPAVAFLSSSQWVYGFKDVPGVQRLGDATTTRQTFYLAAWIDYNFNSWFTGEVGYQIFRNVLNGDGKYGNPFYDAYAGDMRVYLGFNLGLDKLYEAISGQSDTGGVVRAKNEKKPMMTF